ncbi:MAG: hypothetical protein JEZ00_03665 [Anaerolineaceae bacterium]|nr:hypothetical protein [Anaerolineaceae bacterium]
MAYKPLFEGLIYDEVDNPVSVSYVGSDPCYVVMDGGFHRHIPTEGVDRQVLSQIKDGLDGHEDLILEQTMKMIGQNDIFTKAIIANQLKNIDQQIDQLLESGFPEDGRTYMGMVGFKVIINFHGDVVRVDQPSGISDDDSGDY